MMDKTLRPDAACRLSRSHLNHAKSLYAPFFRWALHRRIISPNPIANFELPTSTYGSRQHTPPEVEEQSVLLAKAAEVIPEVAGMEAWYRCRSEPQIVVLVILTIASCGAPMAGRASSSTATLPTPFQTRARIVSSFCGRG
jgi:hypothetical protein